jgi:hypothetical protein
MTPGIPDPARIVEVDGFGRDPKTPQHDYNNPNFWEIEINGIHSNTKFLSQQKLLFFNTRLVSCL